jgi:structural maintenance of chromosome 1
MEVDGGDAAPAESNKPVDFSSLPKSLLAAARAEGAAASRERAKLEAELKAEVDSKASLLEKLAPNLKAGHQYAAVKEKEKELTDELEAAKKASKLAADSFAAKKAERYAAFMAAYTHVARAVDPIYKALTRGGGAHPGAGTGSAELMLESPQEPFLHGVRYVAMPPSKRFRDMEQLSGGEKTVAALALLFAVHSYRPSPFFILDEIDAALDKVNVERVARFIRESSGAGGRGGPRPFQSIVISLKDTLYEKADALVGVYRDAAAEGSSRTLTLDLGTFEK